MLDVIQSLAIIAICIVVIRHIRDDGGGCNGNYAVQTV